MTETAGATCPTCYAGLPTPGAACLRCAPQAPWPSAPQYPASQYPAASYPVPPAHPSFPPMPAPYAQAPQPYGPPQYQPYPPVAVRPVKSAGIAVLLSFLWIGAGHLYLDRIGTGLVLMGAHFFIGFLLVFLFFPLAFLAWLAAFITCAVVCSNLAHQINAGTVPPRVTW